MNIKKIKDDVFEKIGINKYEFFVSAMDYINDFPDIINEFYTDATEISSGEYLGFLINGGGIMRMKQQYIYLNMTI